VSEPTIVWDADEDFERIDGRDDDIPDHARSSSGKTAAALITGRGEFRFETPIWLHPDSAFEMHEAGIIVMDDGEATDVDGVTVFLYRTA
jgi:hypothetical protein